MSKTDSFFIRADVEVSNGTFTENTIDLGSYVDALGKSVLRIHNVQLTFQDATALQRPPLYNAGTGAEVWWQLTTQSQADVVAGSNRSVVSCGFFQTANATGGEISSESAGINLQHWTNGYLIGVESLFLGSEQTGMTSNTVVSIVMECTVETLTQSAAMALALSQQ